MGGGGGGVHMSLVSKSQFISKNASLLFIFVMKFAQFKLYTKYITWNNSFFCSGNRSLSSGSLLVGGKAPALPFVVSLLTVRWRTGLFLFCIHVMRPPCWCTKQKEKAPQVLHNNRVKFPKDISLHCSVKQHGHRDVTREPLITL